MSGGQKGFTPTIDLGPVGRAVNAAIRKAPKAKKPWGTLPAKVRRAMQPTKAQRRDFDAKYVEASTFHVRYQIKAIGDGFEVWDVQTHDVVATFPTLTRARSYVEAHS